MKFVNRVDELRFLEGRHGAGGQSQLIVLYGKRRVGKTELVKQFAGSRPHVYFLADKLPEQNNLAEISELIGRQFKDEFVAQRGFSDWRQLFAYLAPHARNFVFIIDEFPYLIEANPAVPAVFQKGWDEALKASGIYLVLVGSSVSMMEDYVLNQRSPLYGRRTGQLRIGPLRFQDLREFFDKKPFDEAAGMWAVLGGIPYYWERFEARWPLWKNLQERVFAKGEVLYQEAEFLLNEELRQPRIYFSILRALALGKRKLGEILNETGLERHILTKYLSVLRELDLVERETPVTDRNPEKSKRGIYRITDPYFNFWFRFVFLNRGLLEQSNLDPVLQAVRKEWNLYMGPVYEEIARQLFAAWAASGQSPFRITRLGRWWSPGQEIDLVALDEASGKLFCAEVKWTARPVGINILEQLKAKAAVLSSQISATQVELGLFSKSGFTEKLVQEPENESVLLVHGDKIVDRFRAKTQRTQ